ncbi:MAG: aspartate-semialdehyde dehydrogenase [Planctomycetes bacterium]|nr:aspartate-semialdehyde dehydrogenase [Planctomycetota bacterium]
MSLSKAVVAVVGATGAVGREALAILEQMRHPVGGLRCFASARSAGSDLPYAGGTVKVSEISESAFAGVDVAVFCATSGVSKQFAPAAVKAGAWVVDNSSAFRMDPKVPLVVPEVNPRALEGVARPAIIANPNCSTIIFLVAVNPLKVRFGVQSAVVSTYQAVSGAGAAAMDELTAQVRAVLAGEKATCKVFAEQCAFNVFCHNSAVDVATGLNVEETKLILETRKIWNDNGVRITPTCIRVPVYRAHSESAAITLARPASESEVREAFVGAPGVRVIDDRAGNKFPTPLKAAGGDDVLVGRIRPDPAHPLDADGRSRYWCLWCCGDQLRKGAAQNAIQIAELVVA